jgi:hypothetical protein
MTGVLSDKPTIADKLSREESVHISVNRVLACSPPFTFGIHGDWGAGKTSYLKQLRYALDGSREPEDGQPSLSLRRRNPPKNIVTVWFEAWRYQNEPVPVVALLHEIRKQIGRWAALKDKTAKLTSVTARAVLGSIDDLSKLLRLEAVPFNPSRIQEIGEKYEKENLQEKLGSNSIQEHLDNAVSSVLEQLAGKNGRLVVFIDDLDRCSPESAFRLLEGLKIYLSLSRCVFIIGMNQQLVVDSIGACIPASSYPDENSGKAAFARVRAEAYLEKICSSIERLVPAVPSASLMTNWIQNSDLQASLTEIAGNRSNDAWYLPPNPRRLKALVNQLERAYDLLTKKDERFRSAVRVRALLIIVYVYQFHSELFQRWQFNPSFFTYLRDWVRSPLPNDPPWPSYLRCLELPIKEVQLETNDGSIRHRSEKMFPDPYSSSVFWVAPLMIDKDMNEQVLTEVMSSLFGAG